MKDDESPWLEKRFGKWEVNPGLGTELTVNVSGDMNVIIDKLYGPQCSSQIRVRHDVAKCEWVVEEQNFNNDEWIERSRFNAQEFYDDKYKNDPPA